MVLMVINVFSHLLRRQCRPDTNKTVFSVYQVTPYVIWLSPRGRCLDFTRWFFYRGSLANARTERIRDLLWGNPDLFGRSRICCESIWICCWRIGDLLQEIRGLLWESPGLFGRSWLCCLPVTPVLPASSLPRTSLYFLDRQHKRRILRVFPSLLWNAAAVSLSNSPTC